MRPSARPLYRIRGRLLLPVLCLWLHVGSITAQEAPAGRSELVGVVSEEGEGIADVHVLNLTATSAVITDENGYFRIDTAPGDTLMFSAVRYRRRTLVVRPEMLRALRLEVPLEPFVNELDEVVVSPYNLSGDLDADLGRLPEDRTVTSFSLGLPNAARRQWTNTEKKFNEATTGGGIVPLNPILNYFSGRTKRLKKQMAYESRYQKSVEMREQFADSVLTRELGVPRERLPDFMYFCEVDSLFEAVADSGDQLRVWAFLRRKSEEYRKNNNLD